MLNKVHVFCSACHIFQFEKMSCPLTGMVRPMMHYIPELHSDDMYFKKNKQEIILFISHIQW